MTQQNVMVVENLGYLLGRSYSTFLFDNRRDSIRGSREAMRREAIDCVRTALMALVDLIEYAYEVTGRKITILWLLPLLPLSKEDSCPDEWWSYLHTKKLMLTMIEDLGVGRSVVIADLALYPHLFLRPGLFVEPPEELMPASAIQGKHHLYLLYQQVSNIFHCTVGSGRHYAGAQQLRVGDHFVREVLQHEGLELEVLDVDMVPPPRPLTLEHDEWSRLTLEKLNTYYHILTMLPTSATPLIGQLLTYLRDSPTGSTFDRVLGEFSRKEVYILANLLATRHDMVSEHMMLTFFNLQRRPHAKVRHMDQSLYNHYTLSTGWRDMRQYILRIMEETCDNMDVTEGK